MHKWLEKQEYIYIFFFFLQILLMRNTFRMKHSGLNLVWQISFLIVHKKHLADVGEWDRTSLLQIIFIVPEERSVLWCPLPSVSEECFWTKPRNSGLWPLHVCSCMFCCLARALSTLILFSPRIIFIPGSSNLCWCDRENWSQNKGYRAVQITRTSSSCSRVVVLLIYLKSLYFMFCQYGEKSCCNLWNLINYWFLVVEWTGMCDGLIVSDVMCLKTSEIIKPLAYSGLLTEGANISFSIYELGKSADSFGFASRKFRVNACFGSR